MLHETGFWQGRRQGRWLNHMICWKATCCPVWRTAPTTRSISTGSCTPPWTLPGQCHAQAGAEKAYRFLAEHGFPEGFAARVRECIASHRYRKGNRPTTIEAKILFDADKVDVTGAIGIARTLVYKGQVSEPLYTVLPDGSVCDGTGDGGFSFFQEYKYKLEGLYDKFYTARGAEIAAGRRQAAVAFYSSMLQEVSETQQKGTAMLRAYVG